jgi:hypothetical protein
MDVTDLTNDVEETNPLWSAIEANTEPVLLKALPTLAKILENLLGGKEKFLSLRLSNNLLTKNVWPCEGSLELLMSVGMKNIEKDGEAWLSLPIEDLAAQRSAIVVACGWLKARLASQGPKQQASPPKCQDSAAAQQRIADAQKKEREIRQQKKAKKEERLAILGRYKEDTDTRKVYQGATGTARSPDSIFAASSPPTAKAPARSPTNEDGEVIVRIRLPEGSNQQLQLQGSSPLSFVFEAVGHMIGD